MLRRLVVLAVSSCLVLVPATVAYGQAPTVFKKLDFYTQKGEDMENDDAQLIIDARRRVFIFADEDHADRVFATVSWDRITGVSYENSKHARITAGLLVAWPMLFMKGRKHWLTITYGPGSDGAPGGYAFARMDKDNFQTILAAINGFTGCEIRRIEENGEISVLYRGTPGARPAAQTTADTATGKSVPVASSPAPSNPPSSVVTAGALPPKSNEIAAAPLPPMAGPTIEPMVLLNKGVQWTERTLTAVGYVWAAEVSNENSVALDATVVLRLFDAAGAILHEARHSATVPAGDAVAFTAEGEVPEAEAVRADHWEFNIEMPAPATQEPAPAPGRTPSSPPSPVSGGGATPEPLIEPVPLTDDVVKPVLVSESVTIVTDNPALQQINLAGARITIRCLVRADGSVADARVFRILPQITSDATEQGLKEAIRVSAIRFWRFSPAQKDGVAVPVWHMVTVEYQPG